MEEEAVIHPTEMLTEAELKAIAERAEPAALIARSLLFQTQIDEHGEICGVNRQACDEGAVLISDVPRLLAHIAALSRPQVAGEWNRAMLTKYRGLVASYSGSGHFDQKLADAYQNIVADLEAIAAAPSTEMESDNG